MNADELADDDCSCEYLVGQVHIISWMAPKWEFGGTRMVGDDYQPSNNEPVIIFVLDSGHPPTKESQCNGDVCKNKTHSVRGD